MSIVGNRPETGVRIEMTRPLTGGPPWRYRGDAVTAADRHELEATVSAEGEVAVEASPGTPEVIADRARLVLRAAWKHASDDSLRPPRHVVRWRADVDLAPARRGG